MNNLLALLLIGFLGCAPAQSIPQDTCEGGTICQGSRAWRTQNTCGEANTSGLCIRTVDGPLVLSEIFTSSCSHGILVGIKNSQDEKDVESEDAGVCKRTDARWEMMSAPRVPLHLQQLVIPIRLGESLFVGTNGFNEVEDGQCFVTWVGQR